MFTFSNLRKNLNAFAVFTICLFAYNLTAGDGAEPVIEGSNSSELSVSAPKKRKKKKSSLDFMASSMFDQDIDASADKLSFQGDNIVADGHVVIKYKDIWITADRAIVNIPSKDIEAEGRVTFVKRSTTNQELRYKEYLKLLDDPDIKVIRNGYIMGPTGRQLVDVTIIEEKHSWKGDKASGNLTTGVFDLGELYGHYDAFFIKGGHAERATNGDIEIKDAKMTTCEYIKDNHEHYSITASTIKVWPDDKTRHDRKYMVDADHYNILAYNAVLRFFNVPVFYFPIFYKPAWDHGPGVRFRAGNSSDWGYFVQLKKSFDIPLPPKIYGWPSPTTTATVLSDYYSKRGFGLGAAVKAYTRDSKTKFFMYGIHDNDVDKRKGRMEFPSNRYDLWFSHMNHITPRLDFRGRFEKLSDVNFLHDFFRARSDIDPQPATFMSLEYQFNRLSIGAYARPRVNDFFTVVEKLPEIRLDAPRQELFKGLYYQGEMSFSYMRMKWRDFDYPRSRGGDDLEDYETFRFDSLNMFYYPFKLSKVNFIPRAGIRLTSYSQTSKTKIDTDMLKNYAKVDNPYVDNPSKITNYDSKGGAKFRIAAEFGLEVNTKIYRTWSGVKSAYWALDGLRHVMVPYLNYTYIPEPNIDREHIYYFDDIDRITEQNFIRVGIKNRLQTRRGAYGAQEIYNWATIEHYVDFHFNSFEGNDLGNFGTVVNFQPFPDFSAKMDLLLNLGEANVSRFAPTMEYRINDDWKVFGGYYYQNKYTERPAYSMGSSLTDLTSGTAFEKPYGRNQSVFTGVEFPIIDSKTHGKASIRYNFESAVLDEASFGVTRSLHCWEVGVTYKVRQRKDDMDDWNWEHQFMFTVGLSDVPGFKISAKQEVGGANE